MNFIRDTLEYLKQLLTWWVEIMPWEQGIRVFMGKQQKILSPGIWLRLPIVHVVYSQPTRLRFIETPLQTVSTKSGSVLTLKAAIGYQVVDIVKLFKSCHMPADAVCFIALGVASDKISSMQTEEIAKDKIQEAMLRELQRLDFGLEISQVVITHFALVRTFRLIGDSNYIGTDGENINIKKP